MKGLVGIVAQETARYTKFWADLDNVETPDGVGIKINYDGALGEARNAMVRRFREETDADWLMMWDDDHSLSPQVLLAWLKRHETRLNAPVRHPITATLYLTRGAPFAPTLYGPPDGSVDDKGRLALPRISLLDLPTSGVVPVYAAGASGLFVRRDVYDAMPEPWYELGQSDNVGEDFWFCHKAQRLGIPVVVDLDCRIGHLAPFEVWPDVVDGQWVTVLRRGRFGAIIEAADTSALAASVPAGVLA